MAGFPKGHFKHTEETKLRIGAANKGKIVSSETRRKLSDCNKGKPSPMKGKTLSEEAREKIRKARAKQTFSLETRHKMRQAHLGTKSPFWRHGKYKENSSAREIAMTSFEYRAWRKSVFERDDYTCVWCGDSSGGNLEADHIKKYADFPELRLAVDNGRTLCHDCHKTTSTYGNRKSAGV